jgi:hypothetical protein
LGERAERHGREGQAPAADANAVTLATIARTIDSRSSAAQDSFHGIGLLLCHVPHVPESYTHDGFRVEPRGYDQMDMARACVDEQKRPSPERRAIDDGLADDAAAFFRTNVASAMCC